MSVRGKVELRNKFKNSNREYDKLKELDDKVIKDSVKCLKESFSVNGKRWVWRRAEERGESWFIEHHFRMGMNIRNLLREEILSDHKLPTGNWDDYYVELVEIACGLRDIEDYLEGD